MELAVSQQNWAAGELSQKMRGRHELPIYLSGAELIVNFIPETSGPARFRSGFQFVFGTRRYQPAWLWPFQFNDADAYEMEFTTGHIRFYRNGGIITLASQNITAATQASPGVITVAGHGLSNGTEVIINSVVGMVQLNNRSFVIANVTLNTFTLQDNFGNNIDTTAFTAYTSGGTISPVFEVSAPYAIADVPQLKMAQNADVVEFVHHNYEPMQLTRLSDNSWTMATFTRTADPCGGQIVITGITQANPANVHAVGHGYSTGQQVIINGVLGMTQVNNSAGAGYFTITKVDADHFTLNGINSTGYTAYSSAGYSMDKKLLVAATAYYQGRKYYGYSDTYPESIWGSKPLDASGNPQYNDFTLGATAADAFKFTLSPISGKVDKIESLVPSLNFLAINTFEGISKADGDSAGDPISPSTINVTPVVTAGCLQQITPFLLGITMVYIHRSGLVFYSLEFDIFYNAYNAMDKDLTCDQWSQSSIPGGSGIIQMVYQVSRPSAFWFARNDGVMVGRTYMVKENINGIHQHVIGGTSPKVLSVGIMPRTNAYDQLWIVSQRVINGNTVCFVEYANDDVIVPELDRYWSGDANRAADLLRWQNAMFEAQKQYVYVDACLTYDGSTLGHTAGASLTPVPSFLTDGGLEIWTTPAILTNWTLVGAGAVLARVTTPVHDGTYAAQVTAGGAGDGYISQSYAQYALLKGQTVTLGAWMQATGDSVGLLQLTDGVNTNNSVFHPGDGQWHYLTVSLTISASANQLTSNLVVVGPLLTAYFDGAVLTSSSVMLINSSTPIFTAVMVGRQIWKQAQDGVGMGRVKIVNFISTTQILGQILTAFDAVTAMLPGQWYLTTDTVTGIWHLNGEMVDVMVDGGDASPVGSILDGAGRSLVQVVNGTVVLQYQASVVHIGEPYNGLIKSMALVPQSQQGPTVAKSKTVNRLGIKFLNTLGARYGTSLYDMQAIQFAEASDLMGRPSPLFSGVKAVPQEDNTSYDKHIYIQQVRPLPCIVACVLPFVDTDDQ